MRPWIVAAIPGAFFASPVAAASDPAELMAALQAGLRTPGLAPTAIPRLTQAGLDVGQTLGISSKAGAETLFAALAGGITTTTALGFRLKALSADTASHAYQMALDGHQVEAVNLAP